MHLHCILCIYIHTVVISNYYSYHQFSTFLSVLDSCIPYIPIHTFTSYSYASAYLCSVISIDYLVLLFTDCSNVFWLKEFYNADSYQMLSCVWFWFLFNRFMFSSDVFDLFFSFLLFLKDLSSPYVNFLSVLQKELSYQIFVLVYHNYILARIICLIIILKRD